MDYRPRTAAERQEMLDFLGLTAVEDLFADIPEQLRWRGPLDLPPPLSEMEMQRELDRLADRCRAGLLSFLGGGVYSRFIPAAVDALSSQGAFFTSYTPYQAEISQGNLQAIFEYQSLMAALTALPVANASLYDGASSLAEAAIMAVAETGRERVVVSGTVSPESRRVLATYLRPRGIAVVEVPRLGGVTDLAALERATDGETAAVILQEPNYFGSLEPVREAAELARRCGALVVVSADPTSLALLEPPGAYGADIAAGEGQPLGIPLSYGGPYLGYLTAREHLIRRLPGRVVGATVDGEGRTGYVLTFQTREQHIRREKATSNVCTNQALMALRAAIYLATLGPVGLRSVASRATASAHHLVERLQRIPGVSRAFGEPFLFETVLRLPRPADEVAAGLLERGILGGIPLGSLDPDLSHGLLVAASETHTPADLETYAVALEEVLTR